MPAAPAHLAVADVSAARSRVELRGADRRAFLHNFSTNDIRNLADGDGCEAFLLNAKGQVLFYVQVWQRPESIVLEAGAGRGAALLKHLDRYIIREKVTVHDRTTEWGEAIVVGDAAASVLQSTLAVDLPERPNASVDVTGSADVTLTRLPWSPQTAWALVGPTAEIESIRARLIAAGAEPSTSETLEALRIEAGLPLDGVDTSEKNLAQEIDRNDRTLHFRKGCYLGQETVARLDAMGHVNKTLVGLRFASDDLAAVPAAGLELTAGGASVGHVTSAAHSARLGRWIALGYVRQGSNVPGTRLDSSCGPVDVVQLPQA
jgi:folate-binding protein YgfZ